MDLIDREKALGCFWVYEDGDETEMPAYDRLQALPIVAEVEDCVSRQAALDACHNYEDGKDAYAYGFIVEERLQALPSVQPERKRGKWKRTYLDHEAMGERPSIFYCSVCNQCIAYPVNYCPSCGADMRG